MQVPRDSHAEFCPPPDRPDPVGLLELQERSRVPELAGVRHARMLASPFSYFRGAALPMAADLALTPRTGLQVQACGDAHLSNFGLFASPERKLMFDVNDFDETLPAPWEWDVKRLAASLEVAARVNGFSRKDRTAIVTAAAARYRVAMREFAVMGNLAVWYASADGDRFQERFQAEMTERQRRLVAKTMSKARGRDNLHAMGRLARWQDGKLRIAADPPLVVPVADLLPAEVERDGFEAQFSTLLSRYRRTLAPDRRALLGQFRFADMARKVVGVGSVGTRCWIVLMLGRDSSDPLFLQVKEAEQSVLSPFAGAGAYDNQGQRVVAGQRLMQAASDIFLGWERVTGLDGTCRDFYVRQLRDWKFSADIAAMRRPACGCTGRRAPGRWPARTPGPGTASRSPPTWAAPASSTGRSPGSPRPTPTRTSATTTCWSGPPLRGASGFPARGRRRPGPGRRSRPSAGR